jgi:hypothetical protein
LCKLFEGMLANETSITSVSLVLISNLAKISVRFLKIPRGVDRFDAQCAGATDCPALKFAVRNLSVPALTSPFLAKRWIVSEVSGILGPGD